MQNSMPDKASCHAVLRNWQTRHLPGLRAETFWNGSESVTLLAYFFWPPDKAEAQFAYLECSILQSWKTCGLMKTVLVVNEPFPFVLAFASKYPRWMEIQVEPSLIPGRIETMSADCNGTLHSRFQTPYVLIVQDDGFPLQSGLESFLGKWDFIGAPYTRDRWWIRFASRLLNQHVCNGGFSLRSRRICQMAAGFWNRAYAGELNGRAMSEDIFYTETLPRKEPGYRRSIRIPCHRDAIRFSFDGIGEPTRLPFGFHGSCAFVELMGRFGIA